jgi:hypothetical protein
MITDDVVAEFLICDAQDKVPAVEKVLAGQTADDAGAALRGALWNRASQLVSQHFAANDPEWKNARRRIDLCLKTHAPLCGLVSFAAFGVHFVCSDTCRALRELPVVPRDDLERQFAVPEESLKYGAGLSQFIAQTIEALSVGGEYRPWLSVDDLAYLLARAQERRQSEPWVHEATSQSDPDVTDYEVATTFERAGAATIRWFDEQYAPRKNYDPSVRLSIRAALSDHIRVLAEDAFNHPGLAALLCFHLPELNPTSYRKSSYRKDFEYCVRRFNEELRKAAGPFLSG